MPDDIPTIYLGISNDSPGASSASGDDVLGGDVSNGNDNGLSDATPVIQQDTNSRTSTFLAGLQGILVTAGDIYTDVLRIQPTVTQPDTPTSPSGINDRQRIQGFTQQPAVLASPTGGFLMNNKTAIVIAVALLAGVVVFGIRRR